MNRRAARTGRNPFRVVEVRRLNPRVARSSQPWALRRNPFGILGLRRLMGSKSEISSRGNLSPSDGRGRRPASLAEHPGFTSIWCADRPKRRRRFCCFSPPADSKAASRFACRRTPYIAQSMLLVVLSAFARGRYVTQKLRCVHRGISLALIWGHLLGSFAPAEVC
jgi:hypothetical protein